jgi:hypothetical protein
MTIPTKILHSTTPSSRPASLVSGQLAINESDRALYYLDPNTGSPSSLLDQVGSFSPANNLAINGGMEVDQINRGTLVAAVGGYAVDMFKVADVGSAVLASQQVIDAPQGLYNSLKVTVTTANAAPASTDIAYISTAIEGYRAQRLQFGIATTTSISIGFWVKTFRAGVYGLNISNAANNRGLSTAFTVAASLTWQWVSIAIPTDSLGTWPTNNAKSVVISWVMMAGSSLLMAPDTWTAGGQQGVTGQVNGVQSVSDFMQITGVSIFPGYVIPSGIRAFAVQLPFPDMLQQCQRYWQKTYEHETATGTVTSVGCLEYFIAVAASPIIWPVRFPVRMMTAPTVTHFSPITGASGKYADIGIGDKTASAVNPGQTGYNASLVTNASATDVKWHYTADARM